MLGQGGDENVRRDSLPFGESKGKRPKGKTTGGPSQLIKGRQAPQVSADRTPIFSEKKLRRDAISKEAAEPHGGSSCLKKGAG